MNWIKRIIARGLDRLFSRWGNVAFNVSLFVLFAGLAFNSDPGIGRDWYWFVAGTNFGFALFWFVYPRFTAARRWEMEKDMALVMAGAVHRVNEAMGTDLQPEPPGGPDGLYIERRGGRAQHGRS